MKNNFFNFEKVDQSVNGEIEEKFQELYSFLYGGVKVFFAVGLLAYSVAKKENFDFLSEFSLCVLPIVFFIFCVLFLRKEYVKLKKFKESGVQNFIETLKRYFLLIVPCFLVILICFILFYNNAERTGRYDWRDYVLANRVFSGLVTGSVIIYFWLFEKVNEVSKDAKYSRTFLGAAFCILSVFGAIYFGVTVGSNSPKHRHQMESHSSYFHNFEHRSYLGNPKLDFVEPNIFQ